MARFDKVDPVSGSFRARLGFNVAAGDVGDVIAVDLNTSGQVIKAVAAADALAVICPTTTMNSGDVIDCMTHGEIVDVAGAADNVTGAAAGADVFAGAGGAVNVTGPGAGANSARLGHFVEAWRLVVRVQKVQG